MPAISDEAFAAKRAEIAAYAAEHPEDILTIPELQSALVQVREDLGTVIDTLQQLVMANQMHSMVIKALLENGAAADAVAPEAVETPRPGLYL